MQLNSLESSGVISIASTMANFRNLTVLNLAYNNLVHSDSRAIELLSAACKNMRLESLDLSGNRVRFGICQIIGALSHPLSRLVLNGCGIHHSELSSLHHMEVLHHVEHLELGCNALVHCMDTLVLFITKLSRSLKHLNLDENMFNTSTVNKLCSMIHNLAVLSHLSISYNHFLPEDRQFIAREFPRLQVAEYKEWLF